MKKLDDQMIARIAAQPSLFIFLDYDGTLTPIASGPSKAKLSGSVKQLLRELKAVKGVRTAIVSGRSLSNLKKYVRIPGLIYAGNHGFEVQGHGISYIHPAALALEHSFRRMTRRLKKALALFSGIVIEHKRYGISVHYRHVRVHDRVQAAKKILLRELKSLRHTSVVLVDGKKVWEIRPTAEWHKGETISWLMRHVNRSEKKYFFPVYMGDDTTDEDAFRAIRKRGVGIKVIFGKRGSSHARHYVRSTAQAVLFLRKIVSMRKAKDLPNVS